MRIINHFFLGLVCLKCSIGIANKFNLESFDHKVYNSLPTVEVADEEIKNSSKT